VLAGNGGKFEIGPCVFEKSAILLPNGLKLHYFDLNQEPGEFGPQWSFTYGGKPKKLYGGKLLENIVQALARIITMEAALRIQRRMPLGMQVHDELVYGVKTELIEEFKAIALEEMRRRPIWAPTLPLEAEAGVGTSYGEAK
jgi:DNA polymerase